MFFCTIRMRLSGIFEEPVQYFLVLTQLVVVDSILELIRINVVPFLSSEYVPEHDNALSDNTHHMIYFDVGLTQILCSNVAA
jgi:hypothetical protein